MLLLLKPPPLGVGTQWHPVAPLVLGTRGGGYRAENMAHLIDEFDADARQLPGLHLPQPARRNSAFTSTAGVAFHQKAEPGGSGRHGASTLGKTAKALLLFPAKGSLFFYPIFPSEVLLTKRASNGQAIDANDHI